MSGENHETELFAICFVCLLINSNDNSCITYLVVSKSQHTLVVDSYTSGSDWLGQHGAGHSQVGWRDALFQLRTALHKLCRARW